MPRIKVLLAALAILVGVVPSVPLNPLLSRSISAHTTEDPPMPLARIDLIEGKSADYRAGIGEVIYDAMLATLDVPADDRFQIMTEHRADQMAMDKTYLGITRTDDCVIIQITLNEGRAFEKKAAFYRAVADGLHARIGLRKEDVFINLVEVRKENWSFGNGEAQYAPK